MSKERISWENEYPDELEREGRMRPTLARAVRDHEAAGNAADETVAETAWADDGDETAAMGAVDEAAVAEAVGEGGRAKSGRPRETQQQKLARIKRELEAVPTEPGVYLWKDAAGEVIYVGKAKLLRNRVANYFQPPERLNAKTRQLVSHIDTFDIIVTDSEGLAVYDSASENNIRGKYVLYPELVRALDGQAVFYSHYTTGAFLSRAAMPVMNSGRTVGAVYVCESDSERAALIGNIQRRLATITIGIGAAALVVLWFSIKMLTRRITQLADGVRTVQSGDYSFRLTLSGHDELTELGQEFNNLTERLETTEAQRRRFVSDASHELKTPLASIRLLSDSISQSADMDSATMREFVADIGSEAERLQRTTEKLLDLSRRDDGVQPDVTIVDLQQAVHGTAALKPSAISSSSACSSALRGSGWSNVARLSCICAMLDIPLRIIVTPGISCTHRSAQDASEASGRSACSFSCAAAGRFASFPPRTGSMTQMGMLYRFSSSHFSFACCSVQSR